MTVRELSHVELYTKDKIPPVHHLVSALGYERVADSVGVDRSSVLLDRGDIRLVVTSGWATRGFVSRYGEGIADIAVLCDDVATIRDAALAAGATVTYSAQGDPVLSGIGEVVHTLLPLAGQDPRALPSGRAWVPSAGRPEPAERGDALDCFVLHLDPDVLERYAGFCVDVLGFAGPAPTDLTAGGRTVTGLAVYGASGRVAFALVARDGVLPEWPDVLDGGHAVPTGPDFARHRTGETPLRRSSKALR
ncbi:hypothetical protein OHS71_01065 [Streptomyces sp. NBC_00377]|uniref:hypothetical protein n=1 Tax=unclassified Streptomyces TaxID=2593676 RepID=UPI002E214695|nr:MULTISPECIES: hypothetical protein [unclassified Streptomyces]